MPNSPALVLLRHGESEWNRDNRFAGWVDVPLTSRGADEARNAGVLLARAGFPPDVVHTSLLTRAIRSAHIAVAAAGRSGIDGKRSWRLNERHYGILQGRNRDSVVEEFGYAQFRQWRRSYHSAPPPLPDDSPFSQANDPRYARLGDRAPRTESLHDVRTRFLPYWNRRIRPDLLAGKTVLVVTHGNTVRAIVKHLTRISDADIEGVNVPTGIPLVVPFDADAGVAAEPVYLDPERAAAASARVEALGKPRSTRRATAC